LTSFSIHAYSILLELGAKLGHEVAGEVRLLLELVHTVSIWACVSEFTMSKHFKISAQLSFLLAFVLLPELKTFFSILEISLFPSSSCFTAHVFVLHFAVHEDEITGVLICFTLVNMSVSVWVISITIARWCGTICWSIRLSVIAHFSLSQKWLSWGKNPTLFRFKWIKCEGVTDLQLIVSVMALGLIAVIKCVLNIWHC